MQGNLSLYTDQRSLARAECGDESKDTHLRGTSADLSGTTSFILGSLILTRKLSGELNQANDGVRRRVLRGRNVGNLKRNWEGSVQRRIIRPRFHKRSSCSASRTRADVSEVQSLPPVRYTRSGMGNFKVLLFLLKFNANNSFHARHSQ